MALDITAELCLSAMAASLVLTEEAAQQLMQEMSVSPFSEASLALHELLAARPAHFVREQAIKALGSKYCLHVSLVTISASSDSELIESPFRLLCSCVGSWLHGK